MGKPGLIIYEPSGPALEYAWLALNHYTGCRHGCLYCYGPAVMHKTAEEFHAGAEPKKDVLARVGSAAKFYAGTDKRVLLSFGSDPYPEADCAPALTRRVLQILNRNEVPFQVLTKSGLLAARDFDLYGERDAFAVTLTAVDAQKAARFEPGAARPADRIETLREAYNRGIETWVSIEPVLDIEDALDVIRWTGDFVRLYKIGALGRCRTTLDVEVQAKKGPDDWRRFISRAANLIRSHGGRYFFKDSLTRYLGTFEFEHPIENTDNRLAGWRNQR